MVLAAGIQSIHDAVEQSEVGKFCFKMGVTSEDISVICLSAKTRTVNFCPSLLTQSVRWGFLIKNWRNTRKA